MADLLRRLFTYERWFIVYRRKRPFSIPFDTSGFKMIQSPPGICFADPFLIKVAGKNYLFFEDYSFVKYKGAISFVEFDEEGNHTPPVKVLEKDYHLSYPYVFTVDDQIYMIPESTGNNTVELYVATNFPHEWTLAKVLLDGLQASDTTVWFSDGKVWLFTCTVGASGGQSDELSLFYSDSLFGEWHAHPKNPVVCDRSKARPAGRIFRNGSDMIRPSQDSRLHYGHALVFNKITSLTEKNYQEVKLEQVKPDWLPGNLSCHTYNANEDWEVIDGQILTTDLLKPFRKAASLFYSNI